MNIIKIENVRSLFSSTHKVEVKTGYKKNGESSFTTMVILDEDDITNDNVQIKLKGYNIHCLFIPKKFKYTFDVTKCSEWIKPMMIPNSVITYY